MDNDLTIKENGNLPQNIHTAMIQTREMTEIQAMVISAKRFPRDLAQVRADILASCDSPALAEVSQYTYAKGGTEINGPSIRLAEEIANAFTNIDKGWVELERKSSQGNVPGESVVQCFAWDMQRNVKAKRTFTVRHWRDTKKGSYALTDEREIYELMANQAARRLRACILEIVPKFIQEEAVTRCDETLKKNAKGGNIEKRVSDMLAAFAKLGVTKEMLEKRIQHKAEATSESEIIGLHKIYASLTDGMSTVSQWFEADPGTAGTTQSVTAAAPPVTQSIAKGKKREASAPKSEVAPASESVGSGPAAKPAPTNFATPEGIDELKKQREIREEAERKAKAAEDFAIKEEAPAAPPVNEAPTFREIYGECVGACKALGWSPIRLAEFSKELLKKSLKELQDADDTKALMQIYETLLNLLDNPPPKGK